MTWTATRTWTTGELVTAAYANSYWRDDLDHLAAFGSGGTALSALTPSTNLAKVAAGTYTGNGATRSITGVGFSPKFVEIIIIGGSEAPTWRISSRTGTNALSLDASAYVVEGSSRITSLDADGFSLGTNNSVNTNLSTYYWIAYG